MNKNIKGLIAVLIIAGLGFYAYKKLGKPKSVEVVSKYLDSIYGGDHKEAVAKLDNGFVDNWSDAIMKGSQTFDYNGKTYVTQGGKQKK